MFELWSDEWRSGPIVRADTFVQRWRGLRPAPADYGLFMTGCSVHGWGMRVPIWAIAIDEGMQVVAVALLHPRRVVFDRRAWWFLELPVDRAPPSPGMHLAI